jgi:hypothetical protein
MPARVVTRRAAFAGLAAFAVIVVTPIASTNAQTTGRFREIRIDASRLRASEGDPTAAWVEQELPGALAQSLGAAMAPADRTGLILDVRVESIELEPSEVGRGGSSSDSIGGVLIVRGSSGRILSQTPLRATANYFPSSVDQALIEEAYHRRVAALAQAFAGSAPKDLGL